MISFFREQHIYLTALAGLVIFYGLERAAKTSKSKRKETENADTASTEVFAIHVVSFSVYNALIGYLLLHREAPGLVSLFFFWAAMSLHFFTNDYELRMDFKDRYRNTGRWILSGSVLIGWGIGALLTLSKVWIAFLFAFLAGGVVLNVLRGELPEYRQSSFASFLIGAIVYTALLLFA